MPLDDLSDVQDETIEPAPLSTGPAALAEADELTHGSAADAFRAAAQAHSSSPLLAAAPAFDPAVLYGDDVKPAAKPFDPSALYGDAAPQNHPAPDTSAAAFSAWRASQIAIDPQRAADAWDLAESRGLEPTWTAQHYEDIKAGTDQQQTAAILSVHPGLAAQFEDPVKGSVIKNDLEPASAWEHLASGRSAMSTLGNAFLPGVGDMLGGLVDRVAPNLGLAVAQGADPRYPYYTAKAMIGQATDEDYAWLRAHEATPDDLGATNEFEKAIYGAAGAVPFVAELAAAGAATAAAGIVGVPALIVGGVVAGGLTFAQQVGPMYRRMRLAGVDDSTAFDWSVGAGAAAAVINGALAPVAFGIKSLIGKGATEAASDAMIGALTKKGIAWTALKTLGGHYVTGVGMMTATAAANSVAEQMATGGHVDPERLIGDTKEATVNAMEAMAFLAPWGSAADYMRDRGRLARVGEDAARFKAIVDSANGSKVPDAQMERVYSELKQSGVATAGAADNAQTIYVDKPAFDRLAKANGADARTLAANVIGDQGSAYDLADKSGMLAVPIEKYAANMVRSGLHESLKADVKFSPDGWTQNEASGHAEDFRAYAAKSAPLAAEAAAIREREMHKALAAGRSLSQAQAHGDMLQAMILRLANHYKISPEAAYQRFPTADAAGRGSDGEPLASVTAPRPAIGEPATAPTEDFSKTLERQKVKPRPNPYMQVTGPEAEPGLALAPALAADPAKAMEGAGGKYAQAPDEMKQKAEERAKSGAYGKDLEGAKALEPTTQARLSLLPPNPGNLNPERLARLRAAHAEGKDIGPIRLYRNVQSGHSVFVDDGRHRIQLARERGESTIHAQLLGENPPDVTSPDAGHDTTIATPQIANERARYRLREADELVQSHNPHTFDKNPDYPPGVQERDYGGTTEEGKAEQIKVTKGAAAFDPRHVLTDELTPTGGPPIVTEGDKAIVLGGNGRTMMMKRAFEDPAVLEKYREALKAKAAQFGLDPAQIDQMSKPVLVREALGLTRDYKPGNWATQIDVLHEAGRRYNDSLTQSLAARTENISEAKALKPSSLAALATLDAGKGNTQAAIGILRADGVVTDRNIAEWVRDDALTKEAKAKIGQMLTARVMDAPERYAQTSPAVVAKIEKIAPALARVAGINPAFDETPRVQAGLDLLNEAKRAGKTIDQLVGDRQTSLLEKRAPVDPAVLAMAHILEGRGQRDLSAAFEKWAEYAAKDPSQSDMFSRPPTPEGARSILRQPTMDLDGSVQRLHQPEQESRWQYSRKIDLDAPVKVVPMSLGRDARAGEQGQGIPSGIRIGSNDVADREELRDWLNAHVLDKIAENTQAGVKITVGKRLFDTLPKVQNDPGGQVALVHVLELLREAHFYGDELPRPRKPGMQADRDTLRYHHGVALMQGPDNQVMRAHFLIKETRNQGDRFHHLEVDSMKVDERPAPRSIGQDHDRETVPMPGPPGTEKLGSALEGVKDRDGNPVVSLDATRTRTLLQPAFHGTPHDVDKFKMEKIGTGEGAQVYGHGLYFAQNQGIADWYREKLTKDNRLQVKIRGADSSAFMRAEGGQSVGDRFAAMRVMGALMSHDDPTAEAAIQVSRTDAANGIARTEAEIDKIQKEINAGKSPWHVAEAMSHELTLKHRQLDHEKAEHAALMRFTADEFEVKRNAGRLYEVDVPNSDRLLDYDKTLSKQSASVKKAIADSGLLGDKQVRVDFEEPVAGGGTQSYSREYLTTDEANKAIDQYKSLGDGRSARVSDIDSRAMLEGETGSAFYRRLGNDLRQIHDAKSAPEQASEWLRDHGIPGLQYLDSNSRGAGEGDRNFVIWDENEIADLKRLKQQADSGAQERGSLAIIGGPGNKKYEIHLGPGADASTLAHETIHWLVDTLSDAVLKPDAPADLVADHDLLLKWAGYAGGAAERAKGLNIHAESAHRAHTFLVREPRAVRA